MTCSASWVAIVGVLVASCGVAVAGYRALRRNLVRAEQERRKAAEEARVTLRDLADAEALFRGFFDNAPIGKAMTAPDGTFLRVNEAFAAMLGYSVAELQRTSLALITHPDDLAESRECLRALLSGERDTWGLDKRFLARDGRVVSAHVTTRLQRDADGVPRYFLTHIQDTTDRRRAAGAVAASERRYRRLFEAARDGILILDEGTGKIVDVNPFLVELTGYSKDDFLGKHLWEIGLFKDVGASKGAFAELQAQEYIRYDDLPLRTRDGRQVDVEFISNVYLVDDHKVIQCNIRDVTARKQAESELLQSEERFRVLFDHAADCILILDITPEGMPILHDVNRAVVRLLGYTRAELIGQPITFLDVAADASSVTDSRLARGDSVTGAVIEVRHRCKDGRVRVFECSVKQLQVGRKTYGISVERDVTERREGEAERERLREQLVTSQKLESIGTLASGVAHEINNPLNIILNYGQLLVDGATDPVRVRDFAENIVKESERVAGIVSNLLSFARQERDTFSPGRIGDIVERTMSLTGAVLRKDQILVQREIDAGLPVIRCRSQQIQQVLMNLLTNARDALNARYPGASPDKIIRISASRFEKDGMGWVRLTVEDHGDGIPADVAERVFDPFFTTKGRDKGTGLGLSISYSIVREHHGAISFESTPEKGTRFYVDLQADDGRPLPTVQAS